MRPLSRSLILDADRQVYFSKMKIINTEREKFGTRVIDKKNFLRFSEKAKALPGRWQDNMCRLYDEYLFKLYAKKEDYENI